MEKQEKHNTFIDKREKEPINTKSLSSHELVKMKFDKLLGRAPKERGAHKKKNVYNLVVIPLHSFLLFPPILFLYLNFYIRMKRYPYQEGLWELKQLQCVTWKKLRILREEV